MNLLIHSNAADANAAAGDLLTRWLVTAGVRNIMLAAGNTPLELYRLVGEQKLSLSHLNVFALDEYVGVPLNEPRNCANLIRRAAVQPWGIAPERYHTVSSLEQDALASIRAHEQRIEQTGGLDVIILGLGQNGHLGFNEPGSAEDSSARVLDLDPVSIEANRQWFNGDYAPARGATVGLKTILAARKILILAFGPHKAEAVKAMMKGPRGSHCPASFLRDHPDVTVALDTAAAAKLGKTA